MKHAMSEAAELRNHLPCFRSEHRNRSFYPWTSWAKMGHGLSLPICVTAFALSMIFVNAGFSSAAPVVPAFVTTGNRSSIETHSALANDEFDAVRFQSKLFAVVKRVMPSVVAVKDRSGTFSAVIVSPDGLILSAGHAVTPKRKYRVYLSDGRSVNAVGLGANDRVDCAMLKITDAGTWPSVDLGNSSSLVVNQPCVSISHPGQFNPRRGPVVRLGYVIDPLTTTGMIQSTAKMEPGDSGGPLVDMNGKLIGIHSNIRRTVDRNYDVPIDAFRKYWDQLKTPRSFEAIGWPSLPRLGFQVQQNDAEDAVEVTRVDNQSPAQKAGLKLGDEIVSIDRRRVQENSDLPPLFRNLAVTNKSVFTVSVRRSGKNKALIFKLPKSTEAAMSEIKRLPKQFAQLESRLDDLVISISSTINGDSSKVFGTRIKPMGGGNILSKSSLVGDSPMIELGDSKRAAKIIRRDPKNDLVLLSAALPQAPVTSPPIDLNFLPGDMHEQLGKLLLTPDPKGEGQVSIWGSRYFNVPRTRSSGGFLGVELDTRANQVYLAGVQRQLAADRAGLARGDVLLKINDLKVKTRRDVTRFLQSASPNDTVKFLVSRDGSELTKEVILGRRPDMSRHVADSLPGGKSIRRDGFQLAISHDADLRPYACGGPIFDLQGDFLGINMARNSRTRCYIVPKTVLQNFVNQ